MADEKYMVLATDADAEKAEAACFVTYYGQQIAARKLRRGDSLDVNAETGEMVPAITKAYRPTLRVSGIAGGVLPVDEVLRACDGVKVATPKGDVTLAVVEVDKAAVPVKYLPALPADDMKAEAVAVTK